MTGRRTGGAAPLADQEVADGVSGSTIFETRVGVDEDAITITWLDASRSKVGSVSSWGARWRTDVGVAVGQSLAQVVEIAGHFELNGWGGDREGEAILFRRPAPFGCFTLQFAEAPCEQSPRGCESVPDGADLSTNEESARRSIGTLQWMKMGLWNETALEALGAAEVDSTEREGRVPPESRDARRREAVASWELAMGGYKSAERLWSRAQNSGVHDMRVIAAYELAARAKDVVAAGRSLLELASGEDREQVEAALAGAIQGERRIRQDRDSLARAAGFLDESQSSLIYRRVGPGCAEYLRCQTDFCSAESNARIGTLGPALLFAPEACRLIRDQQVRLTSGFNEAECERADASFRQVVPLLLRALGEGAVGVPKNCR